MQGVCDGCRGLERAGFVPFNLAIYYDHGQCLGAIIKQGADVNEPIDAFVLVVILDAIIHQEV